MHVVGARPPFEFSRLSTFPIAFVQQGVIIVLTSVLLSISIVEEGFVTQYVRPRNNTNMRKFMNGEINALCSKDVLILHDFLL